MQVILWDIREGIKIEDYRLIESKQRWEAILGKGRDMSSSWTPWKNIMTGEDKNSFWGQRKGCLESFHLVTSIFFIKLEQRRPGENERNGVGRNLDLRRVINIQLGEVKARYQARPNSIGCMEKRKPTYTGNKRELNKQINYGIARHWNTIKSGSRYMYVCDIITNIL